MAVKVNSGRWKTIWLPKKASTAISADSLIMYESATGYVTFATSAAGAAATPLIGIYSGPAITSASSNYASNDNIAILVPDSQLTTVYADVANTLVAGSPGNAYDLSNSTTVDKNANTYKPMMCVKFLSATAGIFTFNKNLSQGA